MCETWLYLAAKWVRVVRVERLVQGPPRVMMRLDGRGGSDEDDDEGLWSESWLVRLEGMLLMSEVEADGEVVRVLELVLLMLRLQLMVDEG